MNTTSINNTTTGTISTYRVCDQEMKIGYYDWRPVKIWALRISQKTIFIGRQWRIKLNSWCELPSPEQYVTTTPAEWRRVDFGDLHVACIQQVINTFGPNVIPWGETQWSSYEDFYEWDNPSTLEGKLQKSLRNPLVFPKKELEETPGVKETPLEYVGSKLWNCSATLYETPWGTYRRTTRYDYIHGSTFKVEKITLEEAKQELTRLAEREQKEALEKKEYGRHCAVLARKYGLPWKVVSLFKGEEEKVKTFLESLKRVIESHGGAFDYNEIEELYCGRARRRAELERLGIDIDYVDPNKIAPYVCGCLTEGRICK